MRITVSVREQFVLTNPKAMREIHGFPFQACRRLCAIKQYEATHKINSICFYHQPSIPPHPFVYTNI